MEDVKVREFLSVGYGYGYGYGSGDGYGDGDGSGYGYGDGSGSGYGSGSGSGYGYGYGYGSGYGYGDGSGSGYGSGDGYGGLSNINGHTVWLVDGVETVFLQIHGNVAKGYILASDLTMTKCCIVKGGGFFAHGKTLREAMDALRSKLFQDMPDEERIRAFIQEYPELDRLCDNRELFQWHNRLTGSCMAGREAFMKDRGLSLEGQTTVREFIRLTENAYGGSVIRALKEAYHEV